MNTRNVVTAISALTLLTAVGTAHAARCLKGAMVGGVADHVAGPHAVLGAVGCCIRGASLCKGKGERAGGSR